MASYLVGLLHWITFELPRHTEELAYASEHVLCIVLEHCRVTYSVSSIHTVEELLLARRVWICKATKGTNAFEIQCYAACSNPQTHAHLLVRLIPPLQPLLPSQALVT